MTELALTRIFSVVMYYHFAFLAISIALVRRQRQRRLRLRRCGSVWIGVDTDALLTAQSLVYAACTIVALFVLVRLRVGLNYSPPNLWLMLAIYALAALPFFTGGLVVTLAISRLSARRQRGLCRRSDRRRGRLPARDSAARSPRRARRGA